MEKLFLIGGSGFVGKNMVRCFYGQYKLYVIDKYIDNVYFEQYPDVETLTLDLAKDFIPEHYEEPDYIINLASIVTAERDLNLFDEMVNSNLKVLLNLYHRFQTISSLKLFVQFGSCEEYGAEGSPFSETMREQPNSPYALVKQLTTNTALMLNKNYNFPAMVVRPGNLFGPLQPPSKFIPYVIDKLRNNETLNVTLCEQKRDFIYVDDFVNNIQTILENYTEVKGEILNVSSGDSVSLKDIIEHCRAVFHSYSNVNYGAIAYRENEVMDLKCDISKYKVISQDDSEFHFIDRIDKFI